MENNKKLFNCVDGNIYKLPFSNDIKPIVALRINRNLGHNSIETTCLNCGKVDTYSKSDLENCKVYLCKSCGKKSQYINKYANLTIEKIHEVNGVMAVGCKCNNCKTLVDYPLNLIVTGKISRCAKCIGGLQTGKIIDNIEFTRIGTNDSGDFLARLKCTKCLFEKTYKVDSILKVLKEGKSLSKCVSCKCNQKDKAKQININAIGSSRRAINSNQIPNETDLYTNIKPSNKNNKIAFAQCKNCGVKKAYNIQDIIEGEPCDICCGLEVGDIIASKKLNSDEINRLKITDDGRNKLSNLNYKLELKLSNLRKIKFDFEEAKSSKKKFRPTVSCTCNNCLNDMEYTVDNIDTDITKCNACDFKIFTGEKIGVGQYENIVKDIRLDNGKSYIDLECNTCKSIISIPKIDYNHKTIIKCYICEARKKYNIQENNKLVGDIFAYNPISNIGEYTKIGKYIILKNYYDKGKYKIKAQCSECGMIIESLYKDMQEFENKYKDGTCDKCESIMSETKNYINNNNWLGYIKNCRIIRNITTNGDIKIAKVECLLCHDIVEIPLTVFLYSGSCICTKCQDKEVILKCPECHQVHENGLTLKKLYSDDNSEIICPVTRNKVNVSLYKYSNEAQSKLDFLLSNYKEIGSIEKVPGSSDLVRSTNKYYNGTDGEKYYTCYCERHNKLLTLREDEMTTYNHIYCADTRMYGYL